MVRCQVVDGGGGLQMWRVAEIIMNKQLQTSVLGGPLAWEVGANSPHCKKLAYYKMLNWVSDK
jgi:hypothetical protein